jgi:hypothetical protein
MQMIGFSGGTIEARKSVTALEKSDRAKENNPLQLVIPTPSEAKAGGTLRLFLTQTHFVSGLPQKPANETPSLPPDAKGSSSSYAPQDTDDTHAQSLRP